MLTRHPIPRRLAQFSEPVVSRQLHGFCDASTAAYGGVFYLRLLHTDTSVSVSLVTSKTRVAPLFRLTISRLELCGALLLSKLLTAVAGDLDTPTDHLYAWCDSSVVLGWLNMAPAKLGPLLPMDSTLSDGASALTPGHFLIGRPLWAPPTWVDTVSKESSIRRWNLVKRLLADLWTRLSQEHLQGLQQNQMEDSQQEPHAR